jgi:hypothetical protein
MLAIRLPDVLVAESKKYIILEKICFAYGHEAILAAISYYFSSKNEGNLAKEIPEGYEVWENPTSAQVFLRKQEMRLITKEEEKEIKSALEKWCSVYAKFDIRRRQITIYGSRAEKGFSCLKELLPKIVISDDFAKIISEHVIYMPLLRFTLTDNNKRIFSPERWCFRGSIDDWISLFEHDDGSLRELCEELLPHLGQESFYEIM